MHRKSIRLLTRTSLVVALMCLGALIHIPTSPPVTAQTLVLTLSLLLFGARQTCVATLLYIMIGALGLPVFSGFSGGIGHLFGASGGFIFGMLLSSLLALIFERVKLADKPRTVILLASTHAVIYLVGAIWYSIVYLGGISAIGAACLAVVLPYILPDAAKAFVAHLLATRLRQYVQ